MPVMDLFITKLSACKPANLSKRDPTQVFFNECCKNFKNSFFYRALSAVAS